MQPHSVKAVLTNVLVSLSVLALMICLPPLVLDAYRIVRAYLPISVLTGLRISPYESVNDWAALPNYVHEPWARQHFIELAHVAMATRPVYDDFTIFHYEGPYSGSTITIDRDGYRLHKGAATTSPQESDVWMFGGSTMWGWGAPDDGTIPALLERTTNARVFNFAQTAYTAHQSLNLMLRKYAEGGAPRDVVFYDGVNEVEHCGADRDFYATQWQTMVREALHDGQFRDGSALLEVFRPSAWAAQKLLKALGRDKEAGYECASAPDRARLIARAFALTWSAARAVVEQHGGRFHPVLQPVAYIGAPQLAHLEGQLPEIYGPEYRALYAAIREELDKAGVAYTDMTAAFDGEDYLYFDFCHVTPSGNEKIARGLADIMKTSRPR